MTDTEIIQQLSNNNQKVATWLYNQHLIDALQLIMSKGASKDEAKDIYQDSVFEIYHQSINGKVNITNNLKGYLLTMCKFKWYKILRERKKLPESNETLLLNFADELPEEELPYIQFIKDCLETLTEKNREIITLFYFENISMETIANETRMANTDVAKTRKSKSNLFNLKRLLISGFHNFNYLCFFRIG